MQKLRRTPRWKEYYRAYNALYSRTHRVTINAQRRKQYRAQMQLAATIKLARGCLDCGYHEHPSALDFDHRDAQAKRFSIGKQYGAVSNQKLLDEIAKCDVRCANCHRIKTAKEREK